MKTTYPYPHTWIEGDLPRQLQVHMSAVGDEAVWDARFPGDPQPWQSLDHEGVRFSDEAIVSLP